jgi:hypothetical protein
MLILPHLKFSLSFVTDLLSVMPFVTGVTEYLKDCTYGTLVTLLKLERK